MEYVFRLAFDCILQSQLEDVFLFSRKYVFVLYIKQALIKAEKKHKILYSIMNKINKLNLIVNFHSWLCT